jgi:carboxylesterase type B
MTRLEGQTVATNLGEVRGAVEGNAICFRGIPYAASPIGDLRFAPPQSHPAPASPDSHHPKTHEQPTVTAVEASTLPNPKLRLFK